MVIGVGVSILLLLVTVFVPFLQPIFDTMPLTWEEWQWVIGLSLVPAVVEEITKFFIRRRSPVVNAA